MNVVLRSFLALSLAGSLLLGVSARAASCHAHFAPEPQSFALPQRGVLTSADRATIKQMLLGEHGVPAKAAWDLVFDLYVERRLSTIPVHDRAALRAKIRGFSVKFNNVDHFVATSEGMNLPREFENTPIPAIIRAHEIEHVIQLHAKNPNDSGLRKSLFYTRNELDPFLLHRLERDAMLAEWEMISVVPEVGLRHALVQVQGSGIDFGYKLLITRMLSNWQAGRAKHLESQYEMDRYTLKANAKNAAVAWFGIGMNLSVFCGGSYLISWLW